MKIASLFRAPAIVVAAAIAATQSLAAQKQYDPGASDTEIKIGNTMPYSGPASAYGVIGKTIAAYFNKINAEGGINGRKINFISYDDSYNPAKTVEQTRHLVEDDQVLLIFAGLGTQPNAAIRSYMNGRKVPQIFAASGASMWDQPEQFPWTMGFQPSYQTEAHIEAQYLLENHPRGSIAILYQNDDFGKDYLKGLKDGLGGKIPIVAEAAYQVTDASINPQIVKLKASRADILFDATTPKFAAQAIRRVAEIGWKPEHILTTVSESIAAVLKPAGLENAEGLVSAYYLQEPSELEFANEPSRKEWASFMDNYFANGDKSNSLTVYGYSIAQTLVEVLKQCGDDLTRENVMKHAASIKGLRLGMMLPGIAINTSATDYAPIEQMVMMRFSGGRWKGFGPVRSGIDPGAVSEGFKTIFKYGSSTRDTAGQQNANTVTMMTGSFGGTYVEIGADLASVLDDGHNFRLLPVVGRGSVQAVADILFLKGVDVGIVRTDTLDYLEKKGYSGNIKKQFAYITKLYNEEMHVIAAKAIRDIKDLDGKTVAVDLPDGGTFVTAISVFERLGIKPHFLYIEPRVALEMLRKGSIDAVIAVEGKPVDAVAQIVDSALHLVPINYDEPLQANYLPAQLTSDDYPNLIAKGEQVDTIAATSVLAAYNWSPSTDRYRRLALLVDALFSKIKQLQHTPFHPKWKEVTLHATLPGWTRFKPAQEWIDRNAAPVPATASITASDNIGRFAAMDGTDELRSAFYEFLSQRKRSGVEQPDNLDGLFRDFLQWQASSHAPH